MRYERKRVRQIVFLICAMVFAVSLLTACSTNTQSPKLDQNSMRWKVLEGGYAVDVVDATEDFYVNDFAGVFSAEQKAQILQKAQELEEQMDGIEVVITVLPKMEGYFDASNNLIKPNEIDSERFAYSMYAEYGIGNEDMGVLVFLSVEERDICVVTGRQMELYIPVGAAGELIDDYALEYLGDNKFAEGLLNLQDGIIKEIKEVVPENWYDSYKAQPEKDVTLETIEPSNKNIGGTKVIAMILGGLGFIIALVGVIYSLNKQKKLKEEYDAKVKKLGIQHQREIESLKEQYGKQLNGEKVACKRTLETSEAIYRQVVADSNREHQTEIQVLTGKLNSKNQEISNLTFENTTQKEQIAQLNSEVQELKEVLILAKRAHPDLDQELEAIIIADRKEAAATFDEKMAIILRTNPTAENSEIFSNALQQVKELSENLKPYSVTDEKAIEALLDEALMLRNQALAKGYDEQLSGVANLAATRENLTVFKEAMETISEIPKSVIQYMTTDFQKIFDNFHVAEREEGDYRDSCNRRSAKQVEDELTKIYNAHSLATASDYQELSKAYKVYEKLPEEQKWFISNAFITKLKTAFENAEKQNTFYNTAKKAEEKEDEESNRRRKTGGYNYHSSSYSSTSHRSSSSSHSTSHHTPHVNHGGRPGGVTHRKF